MKPGLVLEILPDPYAVCRLDAQAALPAQVLGLPFFSITRTPDELSITLPEPEVQQGWQAECGWRILKVLGPLDFGMIGVLSSMAVPLAAAGVSIFVCSTYDTDYVMVKEQRLEQALDALRASGFVIRGE